MQNRKKTNLKIIKLKNNQGLGKSRKIGFDYATNEYVGVMDSDDISYSNRFLAEMNAIVKHNVDVVGGQITEFSDLPTNIESVRRVPLEDADIKNEMSKRCSMNHVTALFRKSKYYECGGYLEWFCNEDYYLWIRLMDCSAVFMNLDVPLVNVRFDKKAIRRRSGMKYFRSEKNIQKLLLQRKRISKFRYFINVTKRFVGELIIAKIIPSLYVRLTRKKQKNIVLELEEKTIEHESLPSYSVVMSIYKNDDPNNFEVAFKSVLDQTLQPNEIILVEDGPLPDELHKTIANVCELTDCVLEETL